MGPLTPGAQDVLKACARVLPRKEKHLNTIDISNIGWAFATMKNADKEVFETLSSVAVQRIEECNSQDLANLAWAFATAEVRDSALFGAVAKKSVQTMEHFNAQDLSNTAWAFSTANQAHEQLLFSAIASEEAIATVADFRPQAMANIVWAFSTAGVKDAALCDAVAVEAVRRIGTFDAKALTFTARAFSRAGHAAPALFDAIAAQIEKRIRELLPGMGPIWFDKKSRFPDASRRRVQPRCRGAGAHGLFQVGQRRDAVVPGCFEDGAILASRRPAYQTPPRTRVRRPRRRGLRRRVGPELARGVWR
ncbi:hypothetical protein M885DRAFT_444564 [Pelagophyceae sp. CCMP2097]|nr:hypothetical protein M885DRAFT_444564 [Pelagophyceae sp. CCMP2097]